MFYVINDTNYVFIPVKSSIILGLRINLSKEKTTTDKPLTVFGAPFRGLSVVVFGAVLACKFPKCRLSYYNQQKIADTLILFLSYKYMIFDVFIHSYI